MKGNNLSQSENMHTYNQKIKTNLNNEMNIIFEIKRSKLVVTCFYEKNYFKKAFTNSYTLKELKQESSFYNMLDYEIEIIEEISKNKLKGKEYIEGNEETSDTIHLVIPLALAKYKCISFELREEKKTPKQIINEYEYITKIYEHKFKIQNFSSKILIGKDTEKETIKTWISPIKKIKAKLLFSFNDFSYKIEEGKEVKTNLGAIETTNSFHYKCDNRPKILMICQSKNQIFGGYTPLCFNCSNGYGYDNDSFLFSLNTLQKYPKNSFSNTKSIWCYQNYGPSFHYDLCFLEGKMNIINLSKTNYLTKDNWVDVSQCNKDSNGIILDSLEIFQIFEDDYDFEQLNLDISSKINISTNINNNYNNIFNINNINSNRKNKEGKEINI